MEGLLENLGVISRLSENKKLTLRNGYINIDNYNKIQFIIRSWYKEDDRNRMGFFPKANIIGTIMRNQSRSCILIYSRRLESL